MKPTPYEDLVPGKIYYIYQPSTQDLTHDFYRGTFVKKIKFNNIDYLLSLFEDVFALKPLQYMGEGNFGKTEVYYELEKIKENSINAKEQMEKRTLDMILKSILNEDFIY
jgi:hypothetical protein